MNIDQFFNYLAIIAWATFLVLIIGAFVTRWMRYGIVSAFEGLFSWVTVAVLVPVIVITLVAMSIVFVPPTHSGVVISFIAPRGYREQPLDSGAHWIVPLVEQVIMYPIYQQTYTMSSNPLDGNEPGNDTISSRTSDGQEVFIDTSIIFAIDDEQVVRLHILWQDRYVEDLIRPIVRGIVRTQVAAFTVDEVNSIRRQDLERTINEQLEESLAQQGILMERFLVRNIAFSPEYAASVEQKQIALERTTESQYQAEVIRTIAEGRADETIRLAQARADARLIEARAEAEALQLIALVLEDNPILVTYEYVDKIAPNIGVMVVPQDNPLILPLAPDSNALSPSNPLDIVPTLEIPALFDPTPTPEAVATAAP